MTERLSVLSTLTHAAQPRQQSVIRIADGDTNQRPCPGTGGFFFSGNVKEERMLHDLPLIPSEKDLALGIWYRGPLFHQFISGTGLHRGACTMITMAPANMPTQPSQNRMRSTNRVLTHLKIFFFKKKGHRGVTTQNPPHTSISINQSKILLTLGCRQPSSAPPWTVR